MPEEAKPTGGFGKGFGSGAVIVAIVSLIYFFAGKQDPMEAVRSSVTKVIEVSAKGKKLCTELEQIESLTEEQKKTVVEANEQFTKIKGEAEAIGGLLGIQVDTTKELKEELKEMKELEAPKGQSP